MESPKRRGTTEEQALLVAELVEPSRHEAVVRCRSLTKRYGELVAVDEATFSLQAGTVTGFLGPNGVSQKASSPALAR